MGWYDIKAPCMFSVRNVGKTMVTRSTGTKLASDALKGRVIEISLADLQSDEDNGYRKMRLKIEDVQGRNCLTNFYGMSFTTDKLRSLVRKRQNQVKKTCYAQSSQIRQIRKKMADVMQAEASSCDLKEDVLRAVLADPPDPQEDGRRHAGRGELVRSQGRRATRSPRRSARSARRWPTSCRPRRARAISR